MIKFNDDQELIKEFLRLSENEVFDLKLKISDSQKIAKTLVAFTNSKGGRILIGVSDNKIITGIDADEEIYMIEKAAFEFCYPKIVPSFEILEFKKYLSEQNYIELNLLIVEIKASEIPHYAIDELGKKTFYKRKKDKNIPN